MGPWPHRTRLPLNCYRTLFEAKMHFSDRSSDRIKSFPFAIKSRLVSANATPMAVVHEGDHALRSLGHRCEGKLVSTYSRQTEALQCGGTGQVDALQRGELPSKESIAMVLELQHALQLIQQSAEILAGCPTSRLSGEAKSAADVILRLVMNQARVLEDVSGIPGFTNGASFVRR